MHSLPLRTLSPLVVIEPGPQTDKCSFYLPGCLSDQLQSLLCRRDHSLTHNRIHHRSHHKLTCFQLQVSVLDALKVHVVQYFARLTLTDSTRIHKLFLVVTQFRAFHQIARKYDAKQQILDLLTDVSQLLQLRKCHFLSRPLDSQCL